MISTKMIKVCGHGVAALTMIIGGTGLLLTGCAEVNTPTSSSRTTTPPMPPQQGLPPGAGSPVPSDSTSSDRESPGPPMDSDQPAPTGSTAPIPTSDSRTPLAKPGKPGTPRGLKFHIGKVDRTNADDVTTEFGLLFGSYDTKIDNSMNDAGRRAAVLATPTLAKQLRTDTSVVGPDAIWTNLADHHGYTTVRTRLGGVGPNPPDTRTSGARVITLYIQRHGDHGWKPAADDPESFLITLHRAGPDKPWSVAPYKYI